MSDHLSMFRWIAEDNALNELADKQRLDQPLFLDTEFMRERTYWPHLALLQINDGNGCHLIDPLTTSAEQMHDLLASRPLVMHACSEDLEALWMGCKVKPLEVLDTQIGAALCGHDMQCSYQKLVEKLVGVSLPKTATRTNWLQRPLTAEQLEYAAHDVEYLPEIFEILQQQLESQGRLAWWREECARLVSDCQSSTAPEDLWRQVKGAATLDGPSRRRLRRLASWRDASARQRDIPRSFILKDAQMLTIASQEISQRSQLAAIGLHPSALRRFADELLAVLREADQGDIPEALPGAPEPALRARIKRLREYFNKLAASHELAPEVLARRRWIEALARNPESMPEPFSGWRAELIGTDLGDWL